MIRDWKSQRAIWGAIIVLLALCPSVAATTQSGVPISIQWDGEKPDSIDQVVNGGLSRLAYDTATRTFRGTFEMEGNLPQRRTLILSYGGHNYPLDLRVSSTLRNGVSFAVRFRSLRSCTNTHVGNVSKSVNTMPDALTAVLTAGHLLNIATPNDCDPALRRLAVQSRYMRNVQLGIFSQGLFLVPEEFRTEFRQAELGSGRSEATVDLQLARYANIELQLEAIQFVRARNQAISARDINLAIDITNTMITRVDSNATIRAAYELHGATRDGLVQRANTLLASSTGR